MSTLLFPTWIPGFGIDIKREPYAPVVVSTSASGKELRSSWWYQPRYKYQVTFELLRGTTQLEAQSLWNHYVRHFAQIDSFLLVDPDDNAVTSHGFGTGDGSTTAFQLQRKQLGYLYDTLGGPYADSSVARTNLLEYSSSIGTSPWSLTAITATQAQVIAPDGTLTGSKLVGTTSPLAAQSLGTANGGTYTFSVWVQAPSGTVTGNLNLYDTTSSSLILSAAFTATTAWQRVSVTSSTVFSFGHTIAAQLSFANGNTLYAWGAQGEAAAAASRYIATAGAVVTSAPAYWPSFTDGFEPVTDLNTQQPLAISVAGTLQNPASQYTLSSTGAVTFASAPAANAQLTWSGSYYRRVRFADPSLQTDRLVSNWYEAKTINLISVI